MAFLEENQPVPNAEIIALAYHVDYWDYIGWKDPFAKDMFTQRQELYAGAFRIGSIYTPQMVVDGKRQFTGSDPGKAVKAIEESLRQESAAVALKQEGSILKVSFASIPAHSGATFFLAVAEDGLSSSVKRGENAGSKLEHRAVVRDLSSVSSIAPGQKSHEFETQIPYQEGWKKANLKYVVFLQENKSRKILGSNQLKAGPSP